MTSQHRNETTAAFRNAVRLRQQGDSARAEQLCADLLLREPLHADALHFRGLLALERGEDEFGFELICRSLSVNPNQPAALSNLGNRLLHLGRFEEALRSFEDALSLKSDYMLALFNRVNALFGLRRLDAALSDYSRAVQLQSDHFPS